jgi:molybdenum cofactor cytidylyltransferase
MAPALQKHYHSVVVSSLEHERIFAVHEPVAGIILAAGASTRYGQPKQLLDWKGKPFVRAVTRTALDAGLSPVIVVTGAYAENIEDAVQDLQAMIVRNNDWQQGQGSSIKAAMHKLGESLQTVQAGSAIFLLADQPQVTASILWALVEKHAEALYPIVAPMVMDRRANPVLFDRVTFSDLSALEGDVGGRAVFHKHRVEYLPWHDERLLLDVDTPEMYRRLISDETL